MMDPDMLRMGAVLQGAKQTASPADLASIRARLEEQVERARQLGYRATDIADGILGSLPASGLEGATKSPDAPPSAIVDLIDRLSTQLSRIESELGRL